MRYVARVGMLLVALCQPAWAIEPPDAVSALVHVDLTHLTLPQVLETVRPLSNGADPGLCLASPGEVPAPGGSGQVVPGSAQTSLFVFTPLPSRCDIPGVVVGLNLVFADSGRRLARRVSPLVARDLGPPCFSGVLPPEPRRRAPGLPVTAWAKNGRVLVLTSDPTTPGEVSVLYADLTPRPDQSEAIQDLIRRPLPASCLRERRGG